MGCGSSKEEPSSAASSRRLEKTQSTLQIEKEAANAIAKRVAEVII
jgi:hypothetical protein